MRHKRKVTQRMGDTQLIKFRLPDGFGKDFLISQARIERAVIQSLKYFLKVNPV